MAKHSHIGAFFIVVAAFTAGFSLFRPWQPVETADFCSTAPRFETRGKCANIYGSGEPTNPRLFVKAQGPTRNIRDIRDLKIFEWNILNLFERKIPGNTEFSKNVSKNEPMPKSKEQTDGIARLINREDPDVLILLEVENIEALKQYAEKYHPGKYHELLIEGNDERGIDIAFLVKKDLPFDIEMRSEKYLYDNQRDEYAFSRDLPVLLFRETEKPTSKPLFAVVGTHFKSQRDSQGDPNSTAKRTSQVEASQILFDQLQSEFGKIPVMIGGDFNNHVPTSPEFEPLKRAGYRDSISLMPNYKGPNYSHYYFSKSGAEFSQLDSVMVSPEIVSNQLMKSAAILEHIDEKGRTIPAPRNYNERESGHPSDHLPTSVVIDFQRLRELSGNN